MNAEQQRRYQSALRHAAQYKAKGSPAVVIGTYINGRWQYFSVLRGGAVWQTLMWDRTHS